MSLMALAALVALQDGHSHHAPLTATAPIVVAISPEARVAVSRGGALPVWRCGESLRLNVDIVNESASRAPLTATPSTGTRVLQQPGRLTGEARERRTVVLDAGARGPIDITLAFDLGPGTRDIGWRGETHLVMQCR